MVKIRVDVKSDVKSDINSLLEFIGNLYTEIYRCLRCQYSGIWTEMQNHVDTHHDYKTTVTYVEISKKVFPEISHITENNFTVKNVSYEEMCEYERTFIL